jgi:hypothetical protein
MAHLGHHSPKRAGVFAIGVLLVSDVEGGK